MRQRILAAAVAVTAGLCADLIKAHDGADGPLGEWPEFVPIGFITAPHPDAPQYQTHLYGDWGSIVGEEFIFIQDGMLKLLYHSYHETYMTERVHESDVLDDWALGYDAETKIKHTPLVKPGGPYPGPAWAHTDTPGYIQHPLTGEHLIYHTVRPGTKDDHPEWDGLPGYESSLQVATSWDPPAIGVPYEQSYENMLVAELWWEQGWNQEGVIKGGLSEPTAVWVPHLGDNGKVRLFYRGLHGAVGSYWNWRISYADSEDGKTGWVKHEVPTFDPSDPENPAYQWTQPPPVGFYFRGSWQAHCTGDVRADGVHMVLTVSNQNYAKGGRIAYYWSPDWGDTWIGHPDNPIIVAGEHPDGAPAAGFQRTPTFVIDEEYGRYILAYNGGVDATQQSKKRTYMAIADRPGAPCPADFDGDGVVDVTDLLHLLSAWGTADGDADGDGDTDVADLLVLLAGWGECGRARAVTLWNSRAEFVDDVVMKAQQAFVELIGYCDALPGLQVDPLFLQTPMIHVDQQPEIVCTRRFQHCVDKGNPFRNFPFCDILPVVPCVLFLAQRPLYLGLAPAFLSAFFYES